MLDSAPPINVEPAIEVGIPGTDDADVTRRFTFSISSFLVEVEVVKKVVMSPTTCAWSKDTGFGFSDSAGEEGSSEARGIGHIAEVGVGGIDVLVGEGVELLLEWFGHDGGVRERCVRRGGRKRTERRRRRAGTRVDAARARGAATSAWTRALAAGEGLSRNATLTVSYGGKG